MRLLVIDGNSLAHRAFHAIPMLSTSRGLVTNAVYGFTSMLFKILDLLHPELVAVCFDKSKLTFRHAEYRDYKANRPATPDELRPQFPLIKELLQAMRIPILEYEGYEADDLIGALVTQAGEASLESIILTGDQDALQLVSPLTKVLLTRKGITELEEYDEGRVWERFGVTPAQFADYKGLVGDKSDNIPGVPGIGPKTAAGLLKEFGSVEQLIARSDNLPARQQEKIRAHADQALLSKKLATIRRTNPLAVNLEECRRCEPVYAQLLALFSRLEFKSLIRVIREKMPEAGGNGQNEGGTDQPDTGLETYRVVWRHVRNAEELSALVEICRRAGRVALAFSGDRREGIAAAALAVKATPPAGSTQTVEPGIQVFCLAPDGHTLSMSALQALGAICRDETVAILLHGAKNALWLLARHDLRLNNPAFDTMVAAYLLNPASPNLDLPDLALEHLNLVLPSREEPALAARADVILRLADLLAEKIRLAGMERLYFEVELPLTGILAGMEMDGVAVDKERLAAMSRELAARIDALAAEIHRLAGEEFNINSTRQLGHVLFEKLQLPVIKKTKTGYSTDAAVLEELAPSHPVVARILEYRQLVKLKSTYVDGMTALIDAQTGRLHTTLHQTVTATGRLSSAEPNLQNIPIRMEEGRRIRQVFVPRQPGNLILSADYSQIELRVLAHMAQDVNLVEAFRQEQDIHTRTAAEVFGVAIAEVTADLRGRAKAVNFGIIYGISDFGLARDINVSRQEARQYIDNYFARYSGVKTYINHTVQEAREKGYVTTILNRRRYLPDLFSHNRTVRSFGERTAMNTPIQGSAADIIKLAMVRIDREIKRRGLKAKMILQVHDELIFDVPEEEVEEMKALVKDGMENAIKLDVPLVVDMKLGPNWYEVKKI